MFRLTPLLHHRSEWEYVVCLDVSMEDGYALGDEV